jgi:hypothetical protein
MEIQKYLCLFWKDSHFYVFLKVSRIGVSFIVFQVIMPGYCVQGTVGDKIVRGQKGGSGRPDDRREASSSGMEIWNSFVFIFESQ